MNMSNTVSVFADSTVSTGSVPTTSSVAQIFRTKNELRDFSPVFP